MNKYALTSVDDWDLADRKSNTSARPLSNASFSDMLTRFDPDIQDTPPQQSSSEQSSHMGSPRWLDEQLEAALDQNRPWRSVFRGRLSPIHHQDQVYTVPIYSPGRLSPAKIIPDYLVWRQEVLDSAKCKDQRTHVENQSTFEDSPSCGFSDSESQDHYDSSCDDSPLDTRQPRTTRDFQRYFSSRIRLLGLEECRFSSLSAIEKQVVMFHYGSAKVFENRQTETHVEKSRERLDVLSLDDFVKSNGHEDSKKMHEIKQAWQTHGLTVTEATSQRQSVSSMDDKTAGLKDRSLRKRVFRQSERCQPELYPLKPDSDDVFMSPTPSPSLRRRPSALWFFPKPALPSSGATELNTTCESNALIGLDKRNASYPRLLRKDSHRVRRVLSYSTSLLASTKSPTDSINELSQKADELHIGSTRNAQVSPDSPPDGSEKSFPSQSSPSPPSVTEPSSTQSIRAIKRRLSLRQLGHLFSTVQNKATTATSGTLLRHRASSADITTLTSSSSTISLTKTGGGSANKVDNTAILTSDALHKSHLSSPCDDDSLAVIGEESARDILAIISTSDQEEI